MSVGAQTQFETQLKHLKKYIPRFCLLDLIPVIYEQAGFTLFIQRSKIISHISNTFINMDSVFIEVKRVNER